MPCEDGTFRLGRFPALRYKVLGDPLSMETTGVTPTEPADPLLQFGSSSNTPTNSSMPTGETVWPPLPPLPRPNFTRVGWENRPTPWSSTTVGTGANSTQQPNPLFHASRKRSRSLQLQTAYVKRTIPYVSLAVETNGRSLYVHVEGVISNLYIKVPEDIISTNTMIGEALSR